ncbi:unnamed protein product [Cuscuta campestris]|uniref:F-box domain-containing protein n=1 Tax=Cuscuta campestris TaxID=132261 RepID=A0A484MC86_9ASTE|nr:unnamed protein product [Cuscuta campestris]
MKRRQKRLTDLNYDVLKHVIYHLAKSSDGAKSLARAISVCSVFKELAYDRDILKAVTFDDIKLPVIHESFWLPTALLCTCFGVANLSAADKIADYAGMLNAAHKALKRDMFRSRVALIARSTDIEVANTRARKKALDAAMDGCMKICDVIDSQLQKTEHFLVMLKAAQKALSAEVAR